MADLPAERVVAPPSESELKRIEGYILDGLTIDEACILVGYPPLDMKTLRAQHAAIDELIQKKQIEFKHLHLKQIMSRPSDKTSQWLLEKLRPSEFAAPKNAAPGESTLGLVAAIIKTIQTHNDVDLVSTGAVRDAKVVSQKPARRSNRKFAIDQVLN